MAFSDYYLCDCCRCKTFYDAELSYADQNQQRDTNLLLPDGNVGDMIVLCKECSKKWVIRVVERGIDSRAIP